MRRFIMAALLSMIVGCSTVAAGADAAITPQQTGILTVEADVPDSFDREITLVYQETGDDSWSYEFKLNQSNGFKVKQRVEQGTYQCISRDGKDCTLNSEETFSLYGDYDLLVSVVDSRSTSNVTTQALLEVPQPKVVSYAWVNYAIAGLVIVGLFAIVVIVIKK